MQNRPAGVTVIGVVVLIIGVVYVVGGFLSLFSEAALGLDDWAALPIILMLFGLIYILVAKGLFSGSRLAQLIVGIVTVLAIIGLIIDLFAGFSFGSLIGFLLALAVNLIILAVLFGAKGRAFFAGS